MVKKSSVLIKKPNCLNFAVIWSLIYRSKKKKALSLFALLVFRRIHGLSQWATLVNVSYYLRPSMIDVGPYCLYFP